MHVYRFILVVTGIHPVIFKMQTYLIAADHLVALVAENSDNQPLLGQVLEIMETEVKIVWLEGDYSSSWKIAKYIDPNNKRKKVEWTDVVTKQAIILFNFQLTTTNHLRKATVTHLKRKYAEIYGREE